MFSYISEAISSGHRELAKSYISKLIKNKKLSVKESIEVSNFYLRLSMHKRALNILPRELLNKELKGASRDQLRAHFRRAFIHNSFGASYKAKRMIQDVESELKRRGLRIENIIVDYFSAMAKFHLDNFDFALASKFAKQGSQYYAPGKIKYMASWTHYLCAEVEMGNKKQAEEILAKFDEQHLVTELGKFYFYSVKSLYYRNFKKYAEALKVIQEARVYLPDEKQGWPWATYYSTLTALYFHQGRMADAKSSLKRFSRIISGIENYPANRRIELYWKERLGIKIQSLDKVGVRASVNNSMVPFFLGKPWESDLPVRVREINSLQDNNNVWHFNGSRVVPTRYEKINHKKSGSPDKLMIDLCSGIVWEAGSNTAKSLSEIQSRCFTALLGAGSVGISLWSLVDYVYREDFFHLDQGENRIKRLLRDLKAFGICHRRKKNILFPVIDEKFEAIIPMFSHKTDVQHYLLQRFGRVDIQDITDLFQIHRTTAYRWLKRSAG